ncbi:MAG: TolC family protein [Campylobacterales bacterium]|nr:TolC family protein [Campylobacterales bacterium]
MLRIFYFSLLCSFFGYTQEFGLAQLIVSTKANNYEIKAKEFEAKSKQSLLSAQKSDFYPYIDMGGEYMRQNKITAFGAGEVRSGYVTAGIKLFDGGERSALVKKSDFEYKASLLESSNFKNNKILELTQNYYVLLQQKSSLQALITKRDTLGYQLQRLRDFYKAGLAPSEEVERIQASYDSNLYNIESLKLSIEQIRDTLALISGKDIDDVSESTFNEPKIEINVEPLDSIKALEAQQKALEQNVKSIEASKYPTIKLEDTYTRSEYSKLASPIAEQYLLESQNVVTISANMRLFDGGKRDKNKEALQYQKLSLASQKNYILQSQKNDFDLAKMRIGAVNAQLKSTKSSLKASKSTYESIKEQYEAGVVDYLSYLDALDQKIDALARYKEALYEYEMAKALYYYYAGKNIEEYIQ